MKAEKTCLLDKPISYLKLLDMNKLALATEGKEFKLLDLGTFEELDSFNFAHANTDPSLHTVAFSPDGKYLAYSETDQSVVRIINLQTHNLHHSFPTLQNKIQTLCFDPSSKYIIAGAVTGRVYLWNLFSTGQISRLSSFPEYSPHILTQPKLNYVSAAAFSPSGNLVATTGYGGSIVITNIHTEVSPKRITPSHIRINSLYFINEETLACGNVEGAVDIIDLHSAQILKHYQTGLGSIRSIAVSRSQHFLFISGNTNNILLIDLAKQNIKENAYLTLDTKIRSIHLDNDDTLFIACEDGSLTSYPLYPDRLLNTYLKESTYEKAYALIRDFPLLEDSALLNTLEDEWESTLNESLILIENGKDEEALSILEKFSTVPAKRKSLNEIRTVIKNFSAFKTACQNENYSFAYSVVEQIPLLKKTLLYIQMEKKWDEHFLKAQAYVVTHKKHELIETLEPFSRVNSKSCFIQVLLHQPDLFLEFINHVNSHSYENLFAITHRFPCLQEIQRYKNLLEEADVLSDEIREHILTAQTDNARQELKRLSHLPSMKQKVMELENLLSLSERLHHLYDTNDLLASYTLIDKNEDLEALPLAHKLETVWNEKIQHCEQEAQLGNINAIKEELGSLISLNTRSQKIGTLLRLGFITQIKVLIIKKQIKNLQTAFENYLHIFGYDSEVHNLILKLQRDNIVKIELDEELTHHRPRSVWLSITDGKIPDTILQHKF